MYSPTPLTYLTIVFPLLSITTAQTDPPLSLCQTYYGTTYKDVCCPELLSRGQPCDAPVPVANVTDCTAEMYPRGWACCLEGEPADPSNPSWDCRRSVEAADEGMMMIGGDPVGMQSVREARRKPVDCFFCW